MPRKKKGVLPSGSVRVQVYDYTDDSGKRHYQSFTASSVSRGYDFGSPTAPAVLWLF